MSMAPSLPSPGDAANDRRHPLNKKIWIPFLAAAVAGLLVHATLYMNGLVTPDGLWQGEYRLSGMWEVSIGRWGQVYVDLLYGGLHTPALNAFLTILITAFAGALLASLLRVKRMATAILIPVALTCSPMIGMFIAYPYCGAAYALSILLGVLAVYVVTAMSGTAKKIIVSSLCVTFLTSVYQSSLGVMLAVAVSYVLMRLLREPEEIKAIGKDALVLCASAVIGALLYYGLMQIALRAWGVSLSDYKGAEGATLSNILRSIPAGIRTAYRYYAMFFLEDVMAKNPFCTVLIYCVLGGIALVSLVVRLVKAGRNRPYIPVICLLLIAVFPLCCNVINLAVPNTDLYLLMAAGMMMTIPLLISLTDLDHADGAGRKGVAWLSKGLRYAGTAMAALLAWVFILSCQTDASVMLAGKVQTLSLAGRIWQQVETREDYVPGETQVLIAGHPQEGNYPNPSRLEDKANVYANWGMVWTGYDGNANTWAEVYRQYLGVQYKGVSAERYAEISASPAFAQMPLYPSAGSVQMVDDVLVVKISDTAAWAN